MAKPKILIGIPTHRGNIKSGCALPLAALTAGFGRSGTVHDIFCVDSARIDRARNILATYCLQETFTELVFIDDDTAFLPQHVQRLFDARRPVIGTVCVRRNLDLNLALKLAKTMSDDEAITAASEFNYRPLAGDTGRATKQNPFRAVKDIGAGILLVKREVLEKMLSTGKLRSGEHGANQHNRISGPLHGFFDQLIVEGELLSEDQSFCERWRTLCGGEVWADFGVKLGHIGDFTYSADPLATRSSS